MVRTFPKNHKRAYVILDEDAYEKFWLDQKLSSRTIFEEWLFIPSASMNAVSRKNGETSIHAMKMASQRLRERGIMEVKRLG